MPFNASLVIAVIGMVLALAVWLRARRVGPVLGVLVAAFVVMAITDPSIIEQGGQLVGDALSWISDTILNF